MPDFQGFQNRLRKNFRHWSKWARRQGVSCLRIYDRDLPDFPLAIDLYDGHAHVQEFETAWEADADEYLRWMEGTRATIATALESPESKITYTTRRRQKGSSQYRKSDSPGTDLVVSEGGLRFRVNLGAYLDTGLFLDHRITRSMVRERSAGKRFLNLFAYTGSFTVYAAAGGARETVTVDLSKTYQAWSKANLELNGLMGSRHCFVQQDVFTFLEDSLQQRQSFDLIVLDPPSFSNSKRMTGILDVQRDHIRLINQCVRILGPAGEIFFSTNLLGFAFDEDGLVGCRAREITRQTIPPDFARARPHRCWLIQLAG